MRPTVMLATALALATAVGLPGTAAASEAGGPWPWTTYRSADFEVAAGERCAFGLRGEVVSDKERYRTVATFADGSPRIQEWTGQLVVRYVNTDSGAAVERNLTGRGDFEFFADGSWSLTGVGGHFGAGLASGDDPAQGFYVVTGSQYVLRSDADGNRTLVPGHGMVENICETLS